MNKLFKLFLGTAVIGFVYSQQQQNGWKSYGGDGELQWRDSCVIFYKVKPDDMSLQGLTPTKEETKESFFDQCLADGDQCTHVWYYASNQECLKYNAPQDSEMIQQLHFVQYDRNLANVICAYVNGRVDEPQVDLARSDPNSSTSTKKKMNSSPKKRVNQKKEQYKLMSAQAKIILN